MSVLDTTGRALSGALVYFCNQPATVSNSPTPLAVIYSDTGGDILANPVTTNGFGEVAPYLDSTVLYTVVVTHPLIGVKAYYDQWVGGPSTSVFTYTLQAWGGPGTNFTMNSTPNPVSALMVVQNSGMLLNGLGYTLSGNVITLANPLQTGDNLFVLIPSIT